MTKSVCVVGLGSMGYGAAASLVRAGFDVTGVDLRADVLKRFSDEGGTGQTSPANGAANTDVLLIFVVNSVQAEDVLFGENGAVKSLNPGALVCLCTTVPPAYSEELEGRLKKSELLFLDAPVSGGPAKAATGEMTIMASGSPDAFGLAKDCFDAIATKVYELGDKAGAGSKFKMINQLLAGSHIALAAEAMALAIKSDLDPAMVYEVICNSAGSSWMFQNRVPHILEDDYSPRSAVNIWIKDLGIVRDTAKQLGAELPMSSTALGMFEQAVAEGLGGEDDAAVFKIVAEKLGLK